MSQNVGKQTIQFGQVIEHKIFFFKNHAKNETGRLVPDLAFFFKNALYEAKACGLQLSFNMF